MYSPLERKKTLNYSIESNLMKQKMILIIILNDIHGNINLPNEMS